MTSSTVVLDACVIYSFAVRDLLMRLSFEGLLRVRWTETILDETFGSIRRARPDLDPERLLRTRRLMCEAIPECLVEGYEELIETLELPDPGDRHVLAAAIRCQARAVVTYNLKDFPAGTLDSYEVEALHPDDLVMELLDRSEQSVIGVIEEQAGALRDPALSVDELCDILSRHGLVRSVSRIRAVRAGR